MWYRRWASPPDEGFGRRFHARPSMALLEGSRAGPARRVRGSAITLIDRRAAMSTTATAPDLAVSTPGDRELEYTYTFDGSRELLFDVFTRPEHLPHWMWGPDGWTMPVCEADVRPGGAWHYVWRRADGSEMEMNGVYQDVARPDRVVHTEAWGGDWAETLNTVEFHERDGRTTVVARMLFPSREARDRASGIGMLDGVRASYVRLDEYLRTIA